MRFATLIDGCTCDPGCYPEGAQAFCPVHGDAQAMANRQKCHNGCGRWTFDPICPACESEHRCNDCGELIDDHDLRMAEPCPGRKRRQRKPRWTWREVGCTRWEVPRGRWKATYQRVVNGRLHDDGNAWTRQEATRRTRAAGAIPVFERKGESNGR